MVTEHKEPVGADTAGPLAPVEVKDVADTAVRAPAPRLTGTRLRATPTSGGTTIEVTAADFKAHGIDHPTVTFDFRRDNFTIPVSNKKGHTGAISREAADFLVHHEPTRFEYYSGK